MKKDNQPEYTYGFGSVVELKDKFRRNPFIAKVYDNTLKRQRSIGTAPTKEDAVALLLANRDNPTKYNPTGLSFADVYAIAKREHFSHLDGKTQDSYQTAYNHCAELHQRAFVDVSTYDLQNVISIVRDKGDGQPTQKKIKTVVRCMYKYAVKYGVLDVCREEIYYHAFTASRGFFDNIMWQHKAAFFDEYYRLFKPVMNDHTFRWRYFNNTDRKFCAAIIANDLIRATEHKFHFSIANLRRVLISIRMPNETYFPGWRVQFLGIQMGSLLDYYIPAWLRIKF